MENHQFAVCLELQSHLILSTMRFFKHANKVILSMQTKVGNSSYASLYLASSPRIL